MKRLLLLPFVALAVLPVVSCTDRVAPPADGSLLTGPSFDIAPTADLVDQQHYGNTVKPCGEGGPCPTQPGWCNTGSSPLLAWGQTFTPTQNNLTAIEFFVRWWRGGAYTFEVWEWPGSTHTRRIASTSFANLSCGNYEWCRIDFPEPVPLTPGVKHGVVATRHPGSNTDRAICTLFVTPFYTRGGFVAAWVEHSGPPWGDGFDTWFRTFYSPNQPPVANAGPDASVECTSCDGTAVTLDGTGSSDPDGDPLAYTWTGPFPEGGGTVTGPTPVVTLLLGLHSISLTVTDPSGATDTDDVQVDVVDTTPPVIDELTASPDMLWPPNHQMVSVDVLVVASDVCDEAPQCSIRDVASNEADEGLGDGDFPNDIVSTGDWTLDLRAERAGLGSGRVYTITVECVDASGNVSESAAEVTVPLNQGGRP